MSLLQKALDLFASVSAFFTLLYLAIMLKVMLPLGAFERITRSDAALRAFSEKEVIFGIVFFAFWTFLYYFLAKEFISKRIAYFASVVFLAIAYVSMFYTVKNVGMEVVLFGGGIATLVVLAVAAKLFPHALNKPSHFLFTDFLGINYLRNKLRILLLCILPFALYHFFVFIPMVLSEGLQAFGLC